LALGGGEKCNPAFRDPFRIEPRLSIHARKMREIVGSGRRCLFHQPTHAPVGDGLSVRIDHGHLDEGRVP
jgi:hypothetical protein